MFLRINVWKGRIRKDILQDECNREDAEEDQVKRDERGRWKENYRHGGKWWWIWSEWIVQSDGYGRGVYHQAFQYPPCRHRRCKVNTPPPSMQPHFVKARIHFAVYPRTCPYRRCEITSNPPNRPIGFVDAQLWFADAAFCISKHPTSVNNTSISALFPQNPCTIQINVLSLYRQSSPSLLTMLKSCEAFFVYDTSNSFQ